MLAAGSCARFASLTRIALILVKALLPRRLVWIVEVLKAASHQGPRDLAVAGMIVIGTESPSDGFLCSLRLLSRRLDDG